MGVFEKDAISVDVGVRIRELREERGMSMRALARASGLSPNAISVIERGMSSPSVSTLYKLADAMDIQVTAFFGQEVQSHDVVYRRAAERTRVPFMRGVWEGLGGEEFAGRVEPFMLTLESGASSGPSEIRHTGHEFVLCLRGQLEYQIGEQVFLLEAGDSLLFAAQLEHRWRNPGKTVCSAMFVLSGFGYDEHLGESHAPYVDAQIDEEIEEDSEEG